MSKPEFLTIPLTDEMKQFIADQSGSGTFYATPDEYVRDLIRHERDRLEAKRLRHNIMEGYHDVLHGNTREYKGDLLATLKAHEKRRHHD